MHTPEYTRVCSNELMMLCMLRSYVHVSPKNLLHLDCAVVVRPDGADHVCYRAELSHRLHELVDIIAHDPVRYPFQPPQP